MTYEEAVAFLDSRARWGMRPGLERIAALVDVLDQPQRTYPSIHVSGTNGKYSVATLISSILRELGLTVGTYTSPHVESVRERIAIGGIPIEEADFASVLSYLEPFIAMVEDARGDHLTYFETTTAMALEWFFDRTVHAAVLECGLGGEYDATNVADARVAVITNVTRDHVAEFGDDLHKAAWEKAGIVKAGSTVVTGIADPDLLGIVKERAAERGADRVLVFGEDFGVVDNVLAVGGQVVTIRGLHGPYEPFLVPLFGEHQARNAALAITACEAFAGEVLATEEVGQALATTKLPARIEVVGRRPLIVLDGGHNPEAALVVRDAVRDSFAFRRSICVLGMLEDKLIEDVVAHLASACEGFVVTEPDADRAAPADRLVRALSDSGVADERIVVKDGVDDAVAWALEIATEEDLVLVFGSFYTAGEARAWLRKMGSLPQS